jgi:chloride channel protein, CIC family
VSPGVDLDLHGHRSRRCPESALRNSRLRLTDQSWFLFCDLSMSKRKKPFLKYPKLQKYVALIREDISATHSRDLHKWLFVAPVIGIFTGLFITGIALIILDLMWPPLLNYFLGHHWSIMPGLFVGFVLTGLIMQHFTPDPNEHSTEEVIRSYHEHRGRIDMRSFVPKILAAITTVGFGGSAALEGPSIYGGGALGSWLWSKLKRFGLEAGDRRIMLISGAAAGMAAVFRAPLTGLVFALEMPYTDDLAHEALVPSLIASVVAYGTLISFLGSRPLFELAGATSFSTIDLAWSALLGLICGLVCMAFDMTYRRVRAFVVHCAVAHWVKLAAGGLLTGLCGLAFVSIFKGTLIPIGPNYEAVDKVLLGHYGPIELVLFGIFKLAATTFTLGSGGVSAMFVPLFLSGASFGAAFSQTFLHGSSLSLYAAVGMASFIAGGYKTPLAAVVFVAEATGGHACIIPALVGAAVAYAVSGDASVSGDQRLHEGVRVQEFGHLPVRKVMQKQVTLIPASSTLAALVGALRDCPNCYTFPVYDGRRLLGAISIGSLGKVDPHLWSQTPVADFIEEVATISHDCDVTVAFRLMKNPQMRQVLVVTSNGDEFHGLLTRSDILEALEARLNLSAKPGNSHREHAPSGP